MKRMEGDSADRNLAPSAPRWVKGLGIIAIFLGVLFVVLHLTGHGFGDHGMNGMEHGANPR